MRLLKTFLAVICLSIVGSPISASEQAGKNSAEKSDGGTAEFAGAIERLVVARRLASIGLAERDPLALITAARMLARTPVQDAGYAKEGGPVNSDSDMVALDTSEGLLMQARAFSNGDAEILALIEETRSLQPRGRVEGPARHNDVVKRGSTDVYRLSFQGRRSAEIAVIGIGGDIDCRIYDGNGNLIDQDVDNTSTCALSFHPIWTGEFTLQIKNYANRDVPYALLSN